MSQPEPEKLKGPGRVEPRKLAQKAVKERPQGKSALFWVFMVLAGGSVVGLGLLAGLYLLAKDAAEDAIHDAQWEICTSEDGWFTVELPGRAEHVLVPAGGSAPNVHTYKVQVGSVLAEVSHYDLGIGNARMIECDLNAVIADVSRTANSTIGPTEPRSIGGFEGMMTRLYLIDGRHSRVWVVRRGNRVYLLAVQNLFEADTAVADRVFDSFKLTQTRYPATETDGLPGPPRLEKDEKMFLRVGEYPPRNVAITGGTPPYRVRFDATDLPSGMDATFSDAGYLILGGSCKKAGSFTLALELVDAAGFESTLEVRFEVKP